MKNKILLLLISIFTMSANLTAQTTFYVSTSGNNANDGLSAINAFQTISHAINIASSGDVIEISAGTFNEKVTLDKSLTLIGENAGLSGCDLSRQAESIIASIDTAIVIKASAVTLDGIQINAPIGVFSSGFSELSINNNLLNVVAAGIVSNIVNTSTATSSIANNCVNVSNQVVGPDSDPTAGISVTNVTGNNPMTLSNNNVSGSFYGYIFYNNNTSTSTTLSGGLIQGVVQGVAVFNVDNLNNHAATTLNIENLNINNFNGPMGASQVGIYAFTSQATQVGQEITLNIDGLNIDGVQNTATNSAGISLSDFTSAGASSFQTFNITNTTISNCSPRGVHAAGRVTANISECTFQNFGAAGVGYGIVALKPTTNPANGEAHVNVEKSTFISPASSASTVVTFGTRDGGTINANYNSLNFNGNSSAVGANTNPSGGDIVATCNWWGSIDLLDIADAVNGNVEYIPFLRTNDIVNPKCTETWTGLINNDWNNADNWAISVPNDSSDVVVPNGLVNYPEVEVNVTINDLTIEAGAEFTVNAEKEFTVNGSFENDGTFTLSSGATILTNGVITGSGTFNVEQFLIGSGGATPNGRFWYLGTPIAGATSGVFNAAGNSKLWSYNEMAGAYSLISDNTTAMINGEGYVARMAADETVVFSGNNLKNGAYTFSSLSRNMARPQNQRGIHLWANPYPSHLDWNATQRTNMSNTFQYRTFNGTNMVFDSYNAASGIGTNNNGQGAIDQYIPPFQAVWVRSAIDNETGTIAVNNSMRSHQSGNLLKSANDNEIIRLHLSDGNTYDETVVYFNANAENDFDAYDSYKMMINSHQIYSIEDDKKLVMNGLKNAYSKERVALGIEIQNTGTYSIIANELSTYENVVLEDAKLNKFQDLKANGKYEFQSADGIDEDRFILHFNIVVDDVTNSNFETSNEEVKILQFNGNQVKVIIDSKDYNNGLINIYNMTGALVVSQQVEKRENILSLNVASGIYMVEVISNNNKTAKKLFIK